MPPVRKHMRRGSLRIGGRADLSCQIEGWVRDDHVGTPGQHLKAEDVVFDHLSPVFKSIYLNVVTRQSRHGGIVFDQGRGRVGDPAQNS